MPAGEKDYHVPPVVHAGSNVLNKTTQNRKFLLGGPFVSYKNHFCEKGPTDLLKSDITSLNESFSVLNVTGEFNLLELSSITFLFKSLLTSFTHKLFGTYMR
jgi:hypothetical protein